MLQTRTVPVTPIHISIGPVRFADKTIATDYKDNGEVPIDFNTISLFYLAQTIVNPYHHHYAFLTHSRLFCSLRVSRPCSHHPCWRRELEGRRNYRQDTFHPQWCSGRR